MSIRILDENTANRIAAGEVVERPASIVKELVENAIDAGATAVTVEIREGGIGYLRVTDNGCGITPEEVPTAFLRHATSKIEAASDLMAIRTIGFRGEALASIAAVSQLEMTTRTPGADFGTRIELEGGRQTALHEAGCPEGTSIVVRNLFFNTPARLKFLKKPAREAGYVGDTISALILSRPEMSIKLISNGKIVFHSPGDGDLFSAAYSVYGKEVAQHLKLVDFCSENVHVTGFVGGSEVARSNRGWQSLVVNGRAVRHFPIVAAAESVYDTRLMVGRFPFLLLHIELPFDQVDVNVHPNKTEIRLQRDFIVREVVRDAVALALDGRLAPPSVPGITTVQPPEMDKPTYKEVVVGETPLPLPDVQPAAAPPSPAPAMKEQEEQMQWIASATGPKPAYRVKESAAPSFAGQATQVSAEEDWNTVAPAPQEVPTIEPEELGHRYIGQAFLTYLLIENGDTLYIIDQHAAHERLLYERFQRMMEHQQVQSQTLLVPHVLNVTPTESAWIEQSMDTLHALGFEVSSFGPRSYRIGSVPIFMGEPQTAQFFLEVLDSLGDIPRDPPSKKERLAQMACKNAVKAGDTLSSAEVTELMRAIRHEEIPLSCPHGRPILIALTKRQLEKRFGRIVS